MKKKKNKKQAITLIEVMIVILLIGLIGGALAFNMRGSLDEGRKFKTEQAKERVRNILEMAQANGETITSTNWKDYVLKSPLGNKELTHDGWKKEFVVTVDSKDNILITSPNEKKYEKKNES